MISINTIPILVVKSPGRLCDGLISLLENQPTIKLMGVIHQEGDLLRQAATLNNWGVVLLDIDLFGLNKFNLYQLLKPLIPLAGYIILVDTIEQKLQAIEAGASAVLIKGYTDQELMSSIKNVWDASLRSIQDSSKSEIKKIRTPRTTRQHKGIRA